MTAALTDLSHYWSGDLTADNTGDLAPVVGMTRGQQRILRRLLTNPGDYVFQPEYGAGLPSYIGQAVDAAKIAALIRSQLALEDTVAKSPAPQITVAPAPTDPSAISVVIAYNDATTNVPTVLSFNVSK